MKRWRRLALVLSLAGATACGRSTTPIEVQAPCARDVVYEVGGTADAASVTISNAQGNTEQADISVPLTNKTGTEGLHLGELACGTFVYISAQNKAAFGTITCTISADGVAIEHAESSGAYVIASCSGSVS